MSRYYSRAGQPISFDEWAKTFDDKTVAADTIGDHHVSTVWLGIDHRYGDGPPLIFETMIFPECDYCERYSTEEQARAGHAEAVLMVRATT